MTSDTTYPANNGTIHTVAQIIKVVMSSAAEAKLGAIYINCREAIPARQLLKEMGHKQPTAPMQTDNSMSMALGVVLNLIQPKHQKLWTCVPTGYAVMRAKNNSEHTGALARPTRETTSPSITQLLTTETLDQNS